MSLYNVLFGQNPIAPYLMAALGNPDVGRYRDCFFGGTPESPEIHVYTRNGGGNRDDYQDVFDALSARPDYLGDEDDDFDCTYATIRFKVPEALVPIARQLCVETRPPREKWDDLLRDLRSGNVSTEEGKRALDVGEKLIGAITKSLDNAKPDVPK